MRNLVFSKFFSRAIKTIGRKPECYLNAEGLTLWSKISDAAVRFVWPGDVDTSKVRAVHVDPAVMLGVFEMAECHDGMSWASAYSAGDGEGVLSVQFGDGTRFERKITMRHGNVHTFERVQKSGACVFGFTAEAAEIGRALRTVRPCVSKETQRPALCRVHIDAHDGMVRFQATDRFEAGVACVRGAKGIMGDSCLDIEPSMLKLFSDRALGDVMFTCRDAGSAGYAFDVFCALGDGWTVDACGFYRGEFPTGGVARIWRGDSAVDDRRSVLRSSFVCDIADLMDAASKLSAGAADKYAPVVFSSADHGVAVANDSGMVFQVPGMGMGSCPAFGLDGRRLLKLLVPLKAFGGSVQFFVCDDVKPVVIVPVADAVKPFEDTGLSGDGYLLVPMRKRDGGHFNVAEIKPADSVYSPRKPKLVPVVGLVGAPELVFGGLGEQPKPRKQRKQRKPVEQASKAVVVKREAAVERVEPVETVPAEVIEPEPVTAKVERPEQSKPVEPEAVTQEIPEVPPATEPHEVVRTSSAVVVRKVTIPGGKSVRELADVFGMYSHKPRGFRDSKGRRVAYVAFDRSSGVIAYRDFYRRDAQVERDIAVYLKLHGLRLAA